MVPDVVKKAARRFAASAPGRRLLDFYLREGLIASPATASLPEPRDAGGPLQVPGRLNVIVEAPTQMSLVERAVLYVLVRGTRPGRVLEVGTFDGGSALIIASALEDNGYGELFTIDPNPHVSLDTNLFHGRVHFITGESPDAIGRLRETLQESFDLILIDGMHIHEQARKDLMAAIEHASPGAYVLMHDAFHYGISEAIREVLEDDERVCDCGYVCNEPRPVGELITHGGFRLLRVGPRVADPMPFLTRVWERLGKTPPQNRDLMNHDIYYCEFVTPCDYCRKVADSAR